MVRYGTGHSMTAGNTGAGLEGANHVHVLSHAAAFALAELKGMSDVQDGQ